MPPLLTGLAAVFSCHPHRSGEHHRCLHCGKMKRFYVMPGTNKKTPDNSVIFRSLPSSGVGRYDLSHAPICSVRTLKVFTFPSVTVIWMILRQSGHLICDWPPLSGFTSIKREFLQQGHGTAWNIQITPLPSRHSAIRKDFLYMWPLKN